MKIWKGCMLYYLGGCAYLFLEFLFRGWSHGSMFLLGGVCFVLIGQLNRWLKGIPLALRLVVFAGVVTGLELLTGLLVNRDFGVWDYRGLPYNYLGQISLQFSLLWIPVSFAAVLLYTWADRKLER